jgi:hypothetical protein
LTLLNLKGWDKFKAAKTQAEFDENAGDSFSLEESKVVDA